jgi:hypothetical protein
LREGERGGGQAASGPVRRRRLEVHNGTRRGSTGQANGGSRDRGGRRAGERAQWAAKADRPAGPEWATSAGWCSLGWHRLERKRPVMDWAQVKTFGLKWELGARFFFVNLNRVLSSKIKGFKYF